MNYEIVDIIVDLAGKCRVKVLLDENTAQFFKFDHNPTQEEVNDIVNQYLSTINNNVPQS